MKWFVCCVCGDGAVAVVVRAELSQDVGFCV
jgi:hypothetical protein